MELTWVTVAGDLAPGQSPYAHDWIARAAARRRANGAEDPSQATRSGTVALSLALDEGVAELIERAFAP